MTNDGHYSTIIGANEAGDLVEGGFDVRVIESILNGIAGQIIGAAIASFLFGMLGISFGGWIGYLIAGVIGACILVGVVRAVKR